MNQLDLTALSPDGCTEMLFERTLDLTHLRRFGEVLFPQAVAVRGKACLELSGMIWLEYTATAQAHMCCARCLEPVTQDCVLEFRHLVLREQPADTGEEDGNWLLAPGGTLDLADAAGTDLVLAQEGTPLCREDCAGLCPKCGVNRNTSGCGCVLQEPDPRFAALRKLMRD
jgi:Predicted metal-binding, possibly nucleic acid-binding protein